MLLTSIPFNKRHIVLSVLFVLFFFGFISKVWSMPAVFPEPVIIPGQELPVQVVGPDGVVHTAYNAKSLFPRAAQFSCPYPELKGHTCLVWQDEYLGMSIAYSVASLSSLRDVYNEFRLLPLTGSELKDSDLLKAVTAIPYAGKITIGYVDSQSTSDSMSSKVYIQAFDLKSLDQGYQLTALPRNEVEVDHPEKTGDVSMEMTTDGKAVQLSLTWISEVQPESDGKALELVTPEKIGSGLCLSAKDLSRPYPAFPSVEVLNTGQGEVFLAYLDRTKFGLQTWMRAESEREFQSLGKVNVPGTIYYRAGQFDVGSYYLYLMVASSMGANQMYFSVYQDVLDHRKGWSDPRNVTSTSSVLGVSQNQLTYQGRYVKLILGVDTNDSHLTIRPLTYTVQ